MIDQAASFRTTNPYLAATLATVGVPASPTVDYKQAGQNSRRVFHFIGDTDEASLVELEYAWDNPEVCGRDFDRQLAKLFEHSDPEVRKTAAKLRKLCLQTCVEMMRHGFENFATIQREDAGRKMAVLKNVGKFDTVVMDTEPGPKTRQRFNIR